MVLPPRRASLPKKYIEELRVDTTGYLAGATMKEVKRPEGLYNVQVADHPVPDIEDRKWWPSWFDEVVEKAERLLPVADVRTDSGCALNVKPRYLVFREEASRLGFHKYGFYERVFVNDAGEIINEPSRNEMIVKNMRYVNMYTRTECEVTTFDAVKKAAEKQKVWYFEGATVAFVKYELQMEVYKLHIDAWHGWAAKHGFYAYEVVDGVVSLVCVLV